MEIDQEERERRRRFQQATSHLRQASGALWHDMEEFQARREPWPETLQHAHRMIREEVDRRMALVWNEEVSPCE
jgi:hypothetical protein